MNRFIPRGLSSGRAALVISVVALVLALAGTAFSGGSRVPGKNGVKASDISKGAVKKPKIAKKAVTSAKFFLAKTVNENVGIVLAGDCSFIGIATPGIRATDHVVVTPPPGWAETFTLVGTPDPANERGPCPVLQPVRGWRR
jgi:hypothetical protein